MLGQFGNAGQPDLRRHAPGPLHNQIPQPDRTVDNTTIWTPDFSQGYYENLLFSEAPGASMRNFYLEQSSDRVHASNGDVERLGAGPVQRGGVRPQLLRRHRLRPRRGCFVEDAANAWYNDQVAAGKTPPQIDAYLAQFDVWDRYDYDGDGNFNEPDGYIDHFQSIHAGEGEETGGGAQGTDAIWSHRWYAFYNGIGVGRARRATRSAASRSAAADYWIGDYTDRAGERRRRRLLARVRPRPRPARRVRHARQHRRRRELDRLLDDLSQGSYGIERHADDGIGNRPIRLSAWDKLHLGWLNYDVVIRRSKTDRSSSARPR